MNWNIWITPDPTFTILMEKIHLPGWLQGKWCPISQLALKMEDVSSGIAGRQTESLDSWSWRTISERRFRCFSLTGARLLNEMVPVWHLQPQYFGALYPKLLITIILVPAEHIPKDQLWGSEEFRGLASRLLRLCLHH
jgi:hypothetical protein